MPIVDLLAILGTMLAIGVALAGLFVTMHRGIRAEMNEFRRETREAIQTLQNEVSALRERMTRLEGLLEGRREAISARQDAA